MRKNIFLKISLNLFLIFSIALTLFSCNSNLPKYSDAPRNDTENNTEKETEIPNHIKYDNVKDYKIIETENGYRLIFNDISVYEQTKSSDTRGFTIKSLEEFSDRLLKGDLTFNEKKELFHSTLKDDNGCSILNPYCSYRLSHTLPHQVDYEEIEYLGCAIFLRFKCEEYPSTDISVTVFDSLGYYHDYNLTFGNFTKNVNKTEYKMELANGEIVTCYNKIVEAQNDKTQEKYVLSNGTKDIFVSKTYLKNSDNPDNISLYYNVNDTVYFVINASQHSFGGKIPNDEFWLGFNVEAIERT